MGTHLPRSERTSTCGVAASVLAVPEIGRPTCEEKSTTHVPVPHGSVLGHQTTRFACKSDQGLGAQREAAVPADLASRKEYKDTEIENREAEAESK